MINKVPDSLIDLCTELGSDINLVQGAGGNFSYKQDNDFWIKASGTWLSEAKKRDIFVQLGLKEVIAAYKKGSNDFTDCIVSTNGLRPSVETSLHAIMPYKVVVHVHSVNSLSWVARKDGASLVADRLEGLDWAWIDYIRPGLPLTQLIESVQAGQPKMNVLMMASHGLVVCADTVEEVKALLVDVEKRLTPPVCTCDKVNAEKVKELSKLIPPGSRLPLNNQVHILGQNSQAVDLIREGALYPDHVVFLGDSITVLQPSQFDQLEEALKPKPHCVLVEGMGVVLDKNSKDSEEAMLECFALLAPTLPPRSELRYFTAEQLGELLNWDAEKLRQAADKMRQMDQEANKN